MALSKNGNAVVCMKIDESSRRIYSGSTVKSFSHRKDVCGSFKALVDSHSGEAKNQSISKKRLKLCKKSNGTARLVPLRVMFLIIGKLVMI